MTRRQVLVLLMLASTSFNVLFIVVFGAGSETSSGWPFVDIGPAVTQDSYHDRAPALESPFGMIGDIPGGYSLYSGNPLQNEIPGDLRGWFSGDAPFVIERQDVQLDYLLLAAVISIVPLLIVVIAGRRSFGSAETQ